MLKLGRVEFEMPLKYPGADVSRHSFGVGGRRPRRQSSGSQQHIIGLKAPSGSGLSLPEAEVGDPGFRCLAYGERPLEGRE